MRKSEPTHKILDLPVPPNLANVCFILVEPQTPGNIGSAARAIKTMGFTSLIVIGGCRFKENRQAVAFAHGAEEVLAGARVVASLDEAFEGIHRLIGTTHRSRDPGIPQVQPIRDIVPHIVEVSQRFRVGIVFGREDKGLFDSELGRCHLCATIPAVHRVPSLNLAQAVQVIAYEIFLASVGKISGPKLDLAPDLEIERAIRHFVSAMQAIGFRPHRDEPETFARPLRRVFSRAVLENRDVRVLHKIARQIEKFAAGRTARPSTARS
ncbi:MAG: RNA methyltransferase [Verrucomicrobiae bacterium]|nr:RNA methyltransferase [Verrucomicrobiae bacterium]